MAVEVKLPGRTDTIISTLDAKEGQYGAVAISGRFGFVSADDDGKARQAYLLAGTRLAASPLEITLLKPTIPLEVKSVDGTTFHLNEPLPQDTSAVGLYVLAGDTGYEIQSTTENSVTVRDYPAVETGQITILNSTWVDAPR